MNNADRWSMDRRSVLQWLSLGGGAALLAGLPTMEALAQGRKNALVIGLDISDAGPIIPDPAKVNYYTPPFTTRTVYETLVTLEPSDYQTLRPLLAESWGPSPDGKAFRFKLREDVKFVSGEPLTAEDVKFSLDRLVNLKDQPSAYVDNLGRVDVIDAHTVDIYPIKLDLPLLTILTAPSCGIYEKKAAIAGGAVADQSASTKDASSKLFSTTSIGTGPYKLTAWDRNVRIGMARNPNYWNGKPGFERIIIEHMGDGGTQLLALQHGDIDVAFNLTPEQVATLKDNPDIAISSAQSFDYIYMALTSSAAFNPALAKKEARQAIASAIDYDGLRDGLFGSVGVRPASFIPYGIGGSTEAFVRRAAYTLNRQRAKELLAKAGLPNGFEFDLSFGDAAIAGTSFRVVAQKLQSDLAAVGIKANLKPMDYANLRTVYYQGKANAVILSWNLNAVEPWLWGSAAIDRLAKRLHEEVPESTRTLLSQAAGASDPAKKQELYQKFQEVLVDEANLLPLIQPIYRVAYRTRVQNLRTTGAGWMADLASAKPAS